MIRPDKKGVGVLLVSQNRISLYQSFVNSKEKGKSYEEAANLTYSKDGSYTYEARNGNNLDRQGTHRDRAAWPL